MAIKDILIHLDNTEVCKQRLKSAMRFSAGHDSHIIGVALAIKSTINSYLGSALPAGFGEEQQKAVHDAAQLTIEHFAQKAEKMGLSYETHIIERGASRIPETLAFYARHADITILGQPDPEGSGASFKTALIESVLFNSGRPIYLVPYVTRKAKPVKRAVVAWDGGARSARAVNDALPLLKDREETIVLVINPEERAHAHGRKPGADIAAHLRRHGIKVTVDRTFVSDISPDKVILNVLAENGADLLVMGAYGHSRLREMAMGGVTHTILKEMTAPVLMSR